jgi:hypothetical protein
MSRHLMLSMFIPLAQDHVHSVCASTLAANDPSEDRYALFREPGDSNRLALIVADGHGGMFAVRGGDL